FLDAEDRTRVPGRLGDPGRRPRRRLRVPGGVLQRATAALVARLPQPCCLRAALQGEGASSITQVSTESGQAQATDSTHGARREITTLPVAHGASWGTRLAENHGVGSSILPLATREISYLHCQ